MLDDRGQNLQHLCWLLLTLSRVMFKGTFGVWRSTALPPDWQPLIVLRTLSKVRDTHQYAWSSCSGSVSAWEQWWTQTVRRAGAKIEQICSYYPTEGLHHKV